MPRGPAIDRSETPPFLLTLWLSQGGVHQPASAYRHPASHAANQVQIYTWLDTTLKDLVTLFLSARATPASQLGPTHKISFRHVYWEPDTEVWTTKEVGQLSHRDVVKPASEARGHALKTLDDFGFIAGDYIDLAFISQQPQGSLNAPVNGGLGRQILGAGRRGPEAGWGRQGDGPRAGAGRMDFEPSRSGW